MSKAAIDVASTIAEAGYADTRALLQGSAVTGRSFRTGAPFDVGRVSDFDVALGTRHFLLVRRDLGWLCVPLARARDRSVLRRCSNSVSRPPSSPWRRWRGVP
jgi:hypothetical protein